MIIMLKVMREVLQSTWRDHALTILVAALVRPLGSDTCAELIRMF